MVDTAFGEHIKELRKQQGLTLVELSNISGVSNPYLSQIENSKFIPSPEIIMKLSKGLNTDYNDLMQLAGYIEKTNKIQKDTKDLESEIQELVHQKDVYELQIKLIESLRTQEELIFTIKTMADLHNVLRSSSDLYYKDRLLTNEEKEKLLTIIETILG